MISTIKIRHYEERDAEAVRAIFIDAIRGLATEHYSPAQVDVWSGVMGDRHTVHARRTDGRTTWLAVDREDEPLAYIDLEADGHIDHLFCRPEAAGQGLASALYRELEQAARDAGMTYLYVEASESARPVFARHGFTVVRREDFEMSGVPIHNYTMEKHLDDVSR